MTSCERSTGWYYAMVRPLLQHPSHLHLLNLRKKGLADKALARFGVLRQQDKRPW